jgi:succinate-semialdehyde dehydrogenase
MNIQDYVDRGRKACEQIKDYNQEQVDKLVYAAAKIIYQNAEPLAKQAVEETGLGYYEDKIAKNTATPAAFWDYLKDKKSVGIIGENKKTGIIEVAHPVGVIACITPATNPTVTPLGNFMDAIKGKNAIIVSAAPRAAETTKATVRLIRKAIGALGAPEDLIQILDEVTSGEFPSFNESLRFNYRYRWFRHGKSSLFQRHTCLWRRPWQSSCSFG